MTTKRLHSLLRPQRLVLLVATVIAASLAATTNATSASGGPPVSNKAHPVIDANWIYAENWFDSTNFIYKVAGSDGCLRSATTCGTGNQTDPSNNLPENYNERRSSTPGGRASGRPAPRSPTARSASSSPRVTTSSPRARGS